MVVAGVSSLREGSKLSADGVVVNGKIIDVKQVHVRRAGNYQELTVEFSPLENGLLPHTKTFRIRPAEYDALPDKTSIRVRCLPLDPSVAQLEDFSEMGDWQNWLLFGVMAFIALRAWMKSRRSAKAA